VYKPKIKEEEIHEMAIDPEITISLDIIQIGTMNVPIEESGKRPVVPNNQVVTPNQKGSVTDDHEASGSKSLPECFLPRWCPPGSTRTQRRKLQRLRLREKREKELEKKRDKDFNNYRPMVPQGKEWRVKTATQTRVVTLPEGRSNHQRRLDWVTMRSDRGLPKPRPVLLLRSPWFVITRFHLSIL
jgi:hypothetical protein